MMQFVILMFMFIMFISTSPNFQHFWHDMAPIFHKIHRAAFLVPELNFLYEGTVVVG